MVKKRDTGLVDPADFAQPDDFFDYTDYVSSRPDVDPLDYIITSQNTAYSGAPEPVVDSQLGESFLHGLTLHNFGAAPENMFSTEGVSYLIGSMIPLATINRFSVGVTPRLLAGLRNNKTVTPLQKALASSQVEFGSRVALEAGLWSSLDPNFEGVDGFKDALTYTVLGEGLFLGIQQLAKKGFRAAAKETEGTAAVQPTTLNTENIITDLNNMKPIPAESVTDFYRVQKSDPSIILEKITKLKDVQSRMQAQARSLYTNVVRNKSDDISTINVGVADDIYVTTPDGTYKFSKAEVGKYDKNIKKTPINKNKLKEARATTPNKNIAELITEDQANSILRAIRGGLKGDLKTFNPYLYRSRYGTKQALTKKTKTRRIKRAAKKQERRQEVGSVTEDKVVTFHSTLRGLKGAPQGNKFNELLADFVLERVGRGKPTGIQDFVRLETLRYIDDATKAKLAKAKTDLSKAPTVDPVLQQVAKGKGRVGGEGRVEGLGKDPTRIEIAAAETARIRAKNDPLIAAWKAKNKVTEIPPTVGPEGQVIRPRKSKIPTEEQAVKAAEILDAGRVEANQLRFDAYKSRYDADARAFMDTFDLNQLVKEIAAKYKLKVSDKLTVVTRLRNNSVTIPALDDLIKNNPNKKETIRKIVLEAEEEYNKILAAHDRVVQQLDPYIRGRARLPEPEGPLTKEGINIELPETTLRSPHDNFMLREMFAFKHYKGGEVPPVNTGRNISPRDADTINVKENDGLTYTERVTGVKIARNVKKSNQIKLLIEDAMEAAQTRFLSYEKLAATKKYKSLVDGITVGKTTLKLEKVPIDLVESNGKFLPAAVVKPTNMTMEEYIKRHNKYFMSTFMDNKISDPGLRRYIDDPASAKEDIHVIGDETSFNLGEAKHPEAYNNFKNEVLDVAEKTVSPKEYDALPPERKIETIPVNKNFMVMFQNTLEDTFNTFQHGTLKREVYQEIITDVIKKQLGIRNPELLPKGPTSPAARRAMEDIQNTIQENNLFTGMGVAPNTRGAHKELVKKQKILKEQLDATDDINSSLAVEQEKLSTEIINELQALYKSGADFELSGNMLQKLSDVADALSAVNQAVPSNIRRLLKKIEDEAQALAIDDSPFGQLKPFKRSPKSKKGIKDVDTGGKQFETAVHAKITQALDSIASGKALMLKDSVDFVNLKVDVLQKNKMLPKIQNTLYSNILKDIDAWVYNSPRRAYKSEYEILMKDIAAGKKTDIDKLQFQRLFIADILANPSDFVKQAVELNQYGKQIHQLYLALRAGYGDKTAVLKLHSMHGRRHNENMLSLQKVIREIEGGGTNPNTVADEGAQLAAQEAKSKTTNLAKTDEVAGGSDSGSGARADEILEQTADRNMLADYTINDPANELRKISAKLNNYIFIELADKAKLGVQKLKRALSDKTLELDPEGLPAVLRRDGNYHAVRDEILESLGNDRTKFDTMTYNARQIADKIQDEVNKIQFDKTINTADGMQKAKEIVETILSEAPANVSKYLQSIYKTLDDYRMISNTKVRAANVIRAKKGIEPLPETKYLPGYLPVIHDGAFDVYVAGKLQASYASKAEVREGLIKYLNENPDFKGDIRVQPINADLDALGDMKEVSVLMRDAEIGAEDARKFLQEGTPDTGTDLLFRHARKRREGLIETTRKQFDDLIQSYAYQSYKYGELADVSTSFKEAHSLLLKKGYTADANYVKTYQDYYFGRPDSFEKGASKLLVNFMDNVIKIPGVGSALATVGITPGTASFRKLSGMITSMGSFAALGFNIATSLLQLTILGMNVVPILGFKATIKGIRNARLAGKKGTAAYRKYGKILEDLGLDMNVNDGRVAEVFDEAAKVGFNSKVNLKRIKDISLIPFNKFDGLARVVTAIAAKEKGVDIARRVASKIRNNDLQSKTLAEARQFLKREERILYEQYMRLGGGNNKVNLTDDVVLDAFSRHLVDETNFVYNTSNVPFAFNNAVAAPLLQFKTWVQKETMFVLQSIFDTPKKLPLAQQYEEFLKITAAFTALGGIFSMPGGQELDLLLRTVFGVSPKAYFYEKDSPFMDILAGGASMGVGISMEGRMGAGNLFTLIDPENFFGIYPTRVFKGISALKEGRVDKGINYLLPRAIQNMIQGHEIATTGKLMSAYSGDLVFDYEQMNSNPLYNAAVKMMGFESPDETRNRILKYALYDKARVTGNQVRLAKWRAYRNMDNGDFEEAFDILEEYNISEKEAIRLWKESRTQAEAERTTIPNTTRSEELLKDVEFYRKKFN